MVEKRRRVPRQEAGWPGKCKLSEGADSVWRECQVLDISILGAGIQVSQPLRGNLGQKIMVDAHPLDGESIGIQFIGTVRYVTPWSEMRFRVGIQFADLSERELSMLDALERMRVVW